jgi:protein TonB
MQPKETVPEVIPETPHRLVSAAPSTVVLPAAPPVPAALPAVTAASKKTGSVSPVTAKSSGHHRPGNKGAGEKGRGRLSNGSGSGTVAPSNPRLLTQIAPEFPASARRRGAHGVAWVRVQVSTAGSVSEASLHRSCGHDDLDAAAVRTAKRWHFVPATAGGRPVSAAAVVKVVFAAGR